MSTATYIGYDLVSGGAWLETATRRGTSGYWAGDATYDAPLYSYPSYISGVSNAGWQLDTSGPVAPRLERPGGGTALAGRYYSGATKSFFLYADSGDSADHYLSIYAVDDPGVGRLQTYTLYDGSHNPLASHVVDYDFSGGVWVTFKVSGTIEVEVSLQGATPNSVTCAFAWDEAEPPKATASGGGAPPTFTISENWDGVTAPAIPSGWNVDSGATTSGANFHSSPNSLNMGSATPGQASFSTYTGADPGAGATIDVTSYFYVDSQAESGDYYCGPTFRCSSATMDDSSTSCYWVRAYLNPATVSPYIAFSSVINGVVNDIFIVTDNSNGLVPGVWFSIRATSSGGDLFNVVVTRLSDGYTLTSSGAFSSTPSVAIEGLHATAVASGGYYGVAVASPVPAIVYFDDYNATAVPPPSPPAYPRKPVIARIPFQFFIVD